MSRARRPQAGGVTYTEWMVEVDMGDGFKPSPHPAAPYIDTDLDRINEYMRGIIKPKRRVWRTVQIGSWVPDTEVGG